MDYAVSPGFSSGTTNYTATMSADYDGFRINATASDPDASVSVGNTSLGVPVSITVTAPDGSTTVYTVTVNFK